MYQPSDDRYDSMSYRQVGRSGLRLPAISLGLWHNFGDNVPFDRQGEILRTAFDHGITHFDLANNYGPRPVRRRATSAVTCASRSAGCATS